MFLQRDSDLPDNLGKTFLLHRKTERRYIKDMDSDLFNIFTAFVKVSTTTAEESNCTRRIHFGHRHLARCPAVVRL